MIRPFYYHQLICDAELVQCSFQGLRVGEWDDAVGGAMDGDCGGKGSGE